MNSQASTVNDKATATSAVSCGASQSQEDKSINSVIGGEMQGFDVCEPVRPLCSQ
jgi:hypothetical protein